ncbi:hypothetical protein FRC07_008930, partial [Ceratobasidium sp. 392]
MSAPGDAAPSKEITANVEGEGAAQTKSAAKKEAKRLEKAAKFAAKTAKAPPAAT